MAWFNHQLAICERVKDLGSSGLSSSRKFDELIPKMTRHHLCEKKAYLFQSIDIFRICIRFSGGNINKLSPFFLRKGRKGPRIPDPNFLHVVSFLLDDSPSRELRYPTSAKENHLQKCLGRGYVSS